MSAHLQFGPEWMRKGPGKSSTTPTSEAQVSFSSDTNNGVASVSSQHATPTSSTAAKSAWTQVGQQGSRRNLSNMNSSGMGQIGSPSPASPSGPVTSPGAFSFAAAASGVAQSTPISPNSQAQMLEKAAHNGTSADGEASRYTKRLLSLYSTERTANGSSVPEGPAAASQSSASNQPNSQRSKKSFGFATDRDAGRRSQSFNAEAGAQGAGASEYRGGSRGFTSTHAGSEIRDSHRPGLFQRGSASSTGAALPTLPVAQTQGRERVVSGIQGGVLGGVLAPTASSVKKSGKEEELPQRGVIAQDDLDEFGQPAKYTRTSHGPDGQALTRDDWVRLRRERHPNEGPVGPPSDHSGGFTRGFEQRRERTNSSVNKVAMMSHSTGRQLPTGEESGSPEKAAKVSTESTVDDLLQSNAAKFVDSLNLDEDDVQSTIRTSEAGGWNPDTAQWFYRDNSGQVQGPFKASMMQDWYAAKYFNDDLLVRQESDDFFTPLGKILQLIGDSATPFLIQPSQWLVNRIQHTGHHQYPSIPLSAGLPGVQQGFPSPMGQRELPQTSNTSVGWNTSTPSRFGFNDPTMDLFGRHSPSVHQHGVGMNGPSYGHHPFGSPSPFLDNAQLKGQEEYLAMIRENELAEQRRMLEHRQAQLAALAMSRGGGGGGGHIESPTMWNQAQQSTASIDWQALQEAHAHQPSKASEPEGNRNEQPEQSSALLDGKEEANEPLTSSARIDESVQLPEKSREESVLTRSEQEKAVPAAKIVVEQSTEPTDAQITPAEAESMTMVKTKKSRKGKKLNIAPDLFDDGASQNAALSSEASERETPSMTATEIPLSSMVQSHAPAAKAAPWAAAQAAPDVGSGTSLRAIQEAEERRAKTTRQFRQQQTSSVNSNMSSSPAPISMSWGLAMPSSRDQSSSQQSQTPGQSASTGPVWSATSQAGAPKKTLAEIQQEEERRQRALQAASANASTVNDLASSAQSMSSAGVASIRARAYADSASRAQSQRVTSASGPNPAPASQAPGNGWSVVGASGKSNATPQSQASTQPAQTVRSVSMPQQTSESVVVKHNSSFDNANGKAPSADFLQYCRDQLKGLNNMKADDFIEMLLSFPIDATSDVVEIIAESVYAASSTLDGRRFAADFVAKRKQDAQGTGAFKAISNGARSTSSTNSGGQNFNVNGTHSSAAVFPSGTRSASDVLQSQPKPSNSDAFGGFKVVKAKGTKKRV